MQVAMMVSDLDAAMKRHWDEFGIGPWDIYTFDASKVQNYVYRGRSATHSCLIAITWRGETQLELIQPLSGYSIYDEHLERRGEGLHHIKLYYADCNRPWRISPVGATRSFRAGGRRRRRLLSRH